MAEGILDYFGEFDQEAKVLAVKYFYFESEARLYAARLRTEGIPCFISNARTITALPLGAGGIGLHVKETDLAEASSIVARMDYQNQNDQQPLNFLNADHDDIAFEQARNQRKTRPDYWYWLIIVIVALLILRAFLRAVGFQGNWWYPF